MTQPSPSPASSDPEPRSGLRGLPGSIWALGLVSLFMDMSSELIHSLLPLFLVGSLGVTAATLGLIEGAAEAIASIIKVFSGAWSDRIRQRKWLTLAGYGLAAATKPLFPMAESLTAVIVARFSDRVGKGIRGAPRDALITDLAHPRQLGAAFGLRQSLDTIGAVAGPVLAIAAMTWLNGDIRAVLWIGVVPALVAVLILFIGVREAPRRIVPTTRPRLDLRAARGLGRRFWIVAGIGSLMTMARFSEAFLILRAESCGLDLLQAPLVMVAMSGVYALAAYPLGALSDRIGHRGLLLVGMAMLIIADILLAIAASPLPLLLGAAFWGLHMGLTQGLLSAMIAQAAPAALRGTAFGVFHLVTGLALLLASTLAGFLWQGIGPEATFLGGALFSAAAAIGFAFHLRGKPEVPAV